MRFYTHTKSKPEVVPESFKLAYLTRVCHGCGALIDGNTGMLVRSLGRSVCRMCSQQPTYTLVAKKYLREYGVSEGDIKTYKIRFEERPNPHGRNLPPMKVFLVYDLLQVKKLKEKAKEEAPAKKKAKK